MKDRSVQLYLQTAITLQEYAGILYAVAEDKHVAWQERAAETSDLARHWARLYRMALQMQAEEIA